ncbi:Ankyrin repeat domain-containing protein [Balamuthia mandrillaris]
MAATTERKRTEEGRRAACLQQRDDPTNSRSTHNCGLLSEDQPTCLKKKKQKHGSLSADSQTNVVIIMEEVGCPMEELLPEELLCHTLNMLPKESVAAAARTCRRWFSCSPPRFRHMFSLRWACRSLPALLWVKAQLSALVGWKSNLCEAAADSGSLQVLQWARENGCPWDSKTCNRAAANGHLAVLQWARENGCPWSEETCANAAKNGHLEVLKWARENGCRWDERTCVLAAEGGHEEVLKWARDHSSVQEVFYQSLCHAGFPEVEEGGEESSSWNAM